MRILLIDDDTSAVLLARIALEESELDCELTTASGVTEALERLVKCLREPPYTLPDLVLLDLNLRDGSGHDVLTFIKGEPELRHIPVAILSTSSASSDMERAERNGAARYIVKARDFDEFVRSMNALRELA